MKIRGLHLFLPALLAVFVLFSSCRSEFERARLSNDPQKILDKAYEYFEEQEYLKAQTLFELVLNQFRGTQEAEKLFFHYAYTYYHLRQYRLASHYFTNFANTFAYSDRREEARFMAAYSSYELSPTFRLDQAETREAIQGFQDFINAYPNSERVAECNRLIDEMREKLEEKAFAAGELYYDLEQYQAAIQTFRNMLEDFPDTDRAEYIRYRILKSAYFYAQNSIFERRKERYEEASSRYMEYVRKHPEGKYRKEADGIYQNINAQLKNYTEND